MHLFSLKALGAAHAGLNEGVGTFYDMASELWALNCKNQENGLLLDKYRMGVVWFEWLYPLVVYILFVYTC